MQHRRSYLLAAVLCLTLASPAQADEATSLAKLQALRLPVPAHYAITAAWPDGADDQGLGVAGTDLEAGVIYAPHGLDDFQRAHELAHLLDWQSMSDTDHRRFARLLRARARGWWLQAGRAGGMGAAPEWLADTYAVLRTGAFMPGAMQTASYDTPQYSLRRLLRIGHAFERLARRHGLRTRRPVVEAPMPDNFTRRNRDGTGYGGSTL